MDLGVIYAIPSTLQRGARNDKSPLSDVKFHRCNDQLVVRKIKILFYVVINHREERILKYIEIKKRNLAYHAAPVFSDLMSTINKVSRPVLGCHRRRLFGHHSSRISSHFRQDIFYKLLQ
jgi:hypothetical protein